MSILTIVISSKALIPTSYKFCDIMKKLCISLSAVWLAVLTTSAFTADLPSRKEPVAPPPPMWTGFYAGLNAGYNFGTNSSAYSVANTIPNNYYSWGNPPAPAWETLFGLFPSQGAGLALTGTMSNTQSGFIGGGQLGYNYQIASKFVIGLEADIQGTATRGSSNSSNANTINGPHAVWAGEGYLTSVTSSGFSQVQGSVNWLGTVRGRLGYLVAPTTLVYGTYGLAYGGAQANVHQTIFAKGVVFEDGILNESYPVTSQAYWGGGHGNQTLIGYTGGAGVEWLFMPNWSLKAEALYWNLGSMNVNTYTLTPSTVFYSTYYQIMPSSMTAGHVSINYQGIIARAGVNYHFNLASIPVVTKF